MRLIRYFAFVALCIYGATAAVVRKPPAFATPMYTDNYLPAVLQVIFHIVGELKEMEAEDREQNSSSVKTTSPHPPGQEQPLPTTPSTYGITVDDIHAVIADNDEEKYYIPPERYQEEALIISRPEGDEYERIASSQVVTPEINHEESEITYGVPETNYEIPEPDHEVAEEIHLNLSQLDEPISVVIDDDVGDEKNACKEFQTSSELVPNGGITSVAVDTVVKEIYSIIKDSSSLNGKNVSSASTRDDNVPEEKLSNDKRECIEGKNSMGKKNIIAERFADDVNERTSELKDDERFTLIGERVDQVPRPSLVAFLRASNPIASPSLRELAELYDVLSKDARRQGFSKFSGYSDEVLEFLHDSAGGGAGTQLLILLEKSVENKELTRYDAMEKSKDAINDLKDNGSELSTSLRRIFPLRFMP